MKASRIIAIILNIIFICIFILFLLDRFTSFQIKNSLLRLLIYEGMLIFAPIVSIWNLFGIIYKQKTIIEFIVPCIALLTVIIIGPTKIIFASAPWQTQTILYQNKNSSFKTIEFQMQDIGAFGYSKRTVEVYHISNLFMLVKKAPVIIDSSKWIKVDKDVNELQLVEP